MRKRHGLRHLAPRRPRARGSSGEDIDALIRVCKTNWLALMSYLAFVGVTLIGVVDLDFFIPERQTQLPLIGVTIPTTLFFAIAPVLGFMLYAHLHFYLIRLWDALNRPDARAPGNTIPWLIAEFARSRSNRAVSAYPLQRLANLIVVAMIFMAAPIVLSGFWWRSMPKHDGWLTLFWCGLSLFGTLLVGAKSWLHLRRDRRSLWRGLDRSLFWAGLFLLILALGWLRAVNIAHWSGDKPTLWPEWLAQARLEGAVFVETPPGWLPRDEAEPVFRRGWCEERGIPALVCGSGPQGETGPEAYLGYQRRQWCAGTFGPDARPPEGDPCDQHFVMLDQEYERDWKNMRSNAIAALPKRDLSGLDLRQAQLWNARLEGANLKDARLDGANLWDARLEGADLYDARLEGANLMGAGLEGANLVVARLEGANLAFARLDGADLALARLDGADLRDARLDGAELAFARLDGVSFLRARLDGVNLWGAVLWNAKFPYSSFRSVNLSSVTILQEQINQSFGNASVTLPSHRDRPGHWASWELDREQFNGQWRLWRANPEAYRPPPPPEATQAN